MDKPLLLITGVCGRIGTAAAKQFSQNYRVVGLDVIEPSAPLDGVSYYIVDVSAKKSVEETLGSIKQKFGEQIASFIHLAAYYDFTGGAWEKYQKITIDGTRNLLEVLRGFSLEQFVFSSTMLVYKPQDPPAKISEASPIEAKWEYPQSKLLTEKIIEELRGETSSVILRIAGVYDDRCNSIPLSQQILRIYRKEVEGHLFPGNIHHGSSFLHMDDLISALQLIVEKRGALGEEELFVLGEEEVMSFQQIQNELGMLLYGKPWWTLRVPKWFAKLGAFLKKFLPSEKKSFIKPWMVDLADDHYQLDIRLAKEKLGWQPVKKLKNCLPRFISALRENPEKWIKKHEI